MSVLLLSDKHVRSNIMSIILYSRPAKDTTDTTFSFPG